jgi:regulation of enolase protein 1 (concanavalin A-like superfamily)
LLRKEGRKFAAFLFLLLKPHTSFKLVLLLQKFNERENNLYFLRPSDPFISNFFRKDNHCIGKIKLHIRKVVLTWRLVFNEFYHWYELSSGEKLNKRTKYLTLQNFNDMTLSKTKKAYSRLVHVVLIWAVLLLFPGFSAAQTWTGAVSSDWALPGNWNGGNVPTASDDVTIPNVANDPIIMNNTTALARSVVIQNGAILTIDGTSSLTINGSFQVYGFLNSIYNEGTLQNNGQIIIGTLANTGNYGIWNLGIFNNNGTLSIDNVNGIGLYLYGGAFTNAGEIFIGNSALQAQDCIQNNGGVFINTTTGEITLNRAWGNSIWNLSGSFQNSGKIDIGSIANTGNGILSYTSFSNFPGAEIHMDRVPNGIINTNEFTNEGLILMGENAPLTGNGIVNITGGNVLFNNNAGGYISIKLTAVNGILNEANSTFNNNSCATLNIFDNLNNNGTFSNAGLFNVNTAQAHTNSSMINNGIIAYPQDNMIPNVTNQEIIIAPMTADRCDVINPTFNLGSPIDFTIEGIFSDEAATMAAGAYTAFNNTFTPTSLLPEGVHTFYVKITDGSCTSIVPWQLTTQNCCPTISAPTVTQPTCAIPTGTIVVNATGIGLLEYSVNNGMSWSTNASFTGVAPGSYNLRVRFESKPACEVAYGSNPVVLNSPFTVTAIDTWTGCVSTDWATAGNWRDGSVPASTDNVTIPNVSNDPVIAGNTSALARSVIIHAGTVLTINATGSLTINASAVHGLDNYGTVENSGSIIVGNTTAIGAIGIVHRNGGAFNNKPGGYIQIDRALGAQAFYSVGLVNNEGSVNIGSNAAVSGEGIRMEGNTFNNKPGGSIQIDSTGNTGIRLLNSGTVFNNEAELLIGNQSGVKGIGVRIENGCTFNNKLGADLQINRVGILNTNVLGGIRNSGVFQNDANISIGNIALFHAQDGILNVGGSFTNSSTGIISIEKPWGNGVWNNSGSFQNAGTISISNIFYFQTGNFSNAILSTAPFTNHAGAEIHIDYAASGIVSTRAFTNGGLIRIGENGPLVGSGIANIQGANAVFNNNAGGDISIKQTAVDGVQNDVNSIFNNNACASLNIFDNLNNSGIFTNSGLFTVNTNQTHSNSNLTNNGIIEYPQGNLISNVLNNDIIIQPVIADCISVMNALNLGTANSFTAGAIWYLNEGLSMPGGSYNQGTNIFTPINLAQDTPTAFYFNVTDNTNACSRIVSILVTLSDTNPPSVECFNQTINFNGEINISLDSEDLLDAYDACGVQSIVLTPAIINSSQVGQTIPVQVTVTDVHGNSAFCTSQINTSGLPQGWSQNINGVGCSNGNDIEYNFTTQIWTATSTNCYYSSPFISDAMAFAQRTLCGDGSITAQVTGISGSALGWAGVIMRESNSAGAKKAQLTTNMAGNQSRREFRLNTNGAAIPQNFAAQNKFWLRIVRSGNQFILYNSSNGVQWALVGTQTIAMGSCIQIGLVATNYTSNSTVTATYANVSYTGNGPILNTSNPDNGILTEVANFQPDFNVYPNPTSGELNIDMREYIGKNVQIELYSLEGKLMQLIQLDEILQSTQTLLLDRYASGMYFVKLKSTGLPDAAKKVVLKKG